MKLVDLLNEIKVKSPGGIIPVSLDTFKAALVQDMANTAEELEFENPEEYIADFKQALILHITILFCEYLSTL